MADIKNLDQNGLLTVWSIIKNYVSNQITTLVPSWARSENKPTYTASEVGALPSTTKIPSKVSDLSDSKDYATTTALNNSLKDKQDTIPDLDTIRSGATSGASAYQKPSTGIPKSDLDTSLKSSIDKANTAIQEETDPTVPAWAKMESKPTYTASEVGALPNTTKIPNKVTDLSDEGNYAKLASPTFTGTPQAPTAASGTNTKQVATTAFVQTEISKSIGSMTGISFEVVTSLPATGKTGIFYLIADSGGDDDSYSEYIWLTNQNKFEMIGHTKVDLSDYVKTTDIEAISTTWINANLT